MRKKKLKNVIGILLGSLAVTADAAIYFNAKVAGPVTNIYAVDERGNIDKLTDNNAWRDLEHAVSSRGELVFSSNREPQVKMNLQRKSENFNIYLSDRRANKLTQLTRHPDREISPQFSPDGNRIAYLRIAAGKQALHLIRRDGTGDRQLVQAERILGHSWSPDGKKIAFAAIDRGRSTLNTVAVQTGEVGQLIYANHQSSPATAAKAHTQLESPRWAPNGQAIAYIEHPLSANGSRTALVLDLQANKSVKISPDGAQVQAPLVWSRDGKRLLYSALVNYRYRYDDSVHRKVYEGGMHIFLSTLGGETRQITRGDHLFSRPVFSPDEQRIAYLYAEKLGGARTFSLRTVTTGGEDMRELYSQVARQSSVIWR